MEKNLEAMRDRIKELEKEVEDGKKRSLNTKTVGVQSTSDEQRALRAFNCRDVKDLLAVDTSDARYSHVSSELKQQVLNLKTDVDTARAIAVLYYGGKSDRIGRSEKDDKIQNLKKEMEASPWAREVALGKLKAYDTTSGADWLAEITASSYMAEFELERKVTQLFRDVPMPSNPYNHPTKDGHTVAKIVGENVAATEQSAPLGKLQFDSTKLGDHAIIPEEMDEDSAVAILPAIRMDVIEAQERAYELAIISGQKSGAIDTVAIPADDARLAWDGLRKRALANSAFGGTYDFSGTLDTAGLKAMKKNGGKYTVNPMACAWIASPSVYHQMTGLDDFSTAEKFGNTLFTNLTGVLGVCLGIPVITSEYLPENLNVAGIEDGVTETTSGLLLVNRQRFFVGTRRPIRVRVAPDLPQHDRWLMSSYSRKDFQGRAQSSSETSVVYGFNILA